MDISKLSNKELDEQINLLKLEKGKRNSIKRKEFFRKYESNVTECFNKICDLKIKIEQYEEKLGQYKDEYCKIRDIPLNNDYFQVCHNCNEYKFVTLVSDNEFYYCDKCCELKGYCFECGDKNNNCLCNNKLDNCVRCNNFTLVTQVDDILFDNEPVCAECCKSLGFCFKCHNNAINGNCKRSECKEDKYDYDYCNKCWKYKYTVNIDDINVLCEQCCKSKGYSF
jgi:hypothetical protein